jgi:hypothetical protein
MTIRYAANIEGSPVATVSLHFNPEKADVRIPLEKQAPEISEQYGKKPDLISTDIRDWVAVIRCNLDHGNVLTLTQQNQLSLENESIWKMHEETGSRKAVQANPTPKF